jgi:hypothetical protein
MSQPVKLSDNLVLDARLAGEIIERSIAGQVEFWARLGRSVDQLLEGQQVMALCRNADNRPLSELLATVNAPEGRQRLAAYLETLPFPHFQAHSDRPGLLEKIDEDGTRTIGRFVNRKFVPARSPAKRTSKPAKSVAPVSSSTHSSARSSARSSTRSTRALAAVGD